MEENLIYIAAGAVITLCVEYVRYRYTTAARIKSFRAAAITELKQLESRMLLVYAGVVLRIGKYDTSFVNWLKANVNRFSAVLPDNEQSKEKISFIQNLNVEGVSDEQLFQMISLHRGVRKDTLSLSKLELPLIRASQEHLGQCDLDFAHSILDILTQLDFYNESVEQSRWYFKKTFDSSLSQQNRDTMSKNRDNLYDYVSEVSLRVADMINTLVEKHN